MKSHSPRVLQVMTLIAMSLLVTGCGGGGSTVATTGTGGGAGTGTATPGTLALSAANYIFAQASGTASVVVSRTGGSAGAISVHYATANGTATSGTDYTATSGTLNWADGDAASKNIAVPLGATAFSGSKAFSVALSAPTGSATMGAPATATVTINGSSAASAGTLSLAAAAVSVPQATGSAQLSVSRTGGSSGAITVHYATANGTASSGTHYTANSGTLSWASGDAAAKIIPVTIASTAFSGSRDFSVTISAPTGSATLGTPAVETVTVIGSAGGSPGISFPGGNPVQPGTAAAIGAPTATIFNDLITIADKSAHTPLHAVAGAAGTMPAALAGDNLPYIPNMKVLARGDAIILYFSNVAGAADYRAYAVTNNVTFTNTANGTQPRGAVIACAGYRQHTYQSEVNAGRHTREVLQAIEIPGFVNPGDYTIVVEATSTPCPFVGMPSTVDAQITMANNGTTTNAHLTQGATYKYSGIPMAVFRSFDTIKAQYGNEIINGQGSPISWANRATVAKLGGIVPPNDAIMPSDPRAIARSAIAVRMPFFDEPVNAPIFDIGTHSVFETFAVDSKVVPADIGANPDYAAYNGFTINPLFVFKNPTINSEEWEFWGRFTQGVDATPGTAYTGGANANALNGVQVFSRHGRLYTTIGDAGQDVGGTLAFSSLRAPIVTMDGQKYIHSMFRINSDASHRRYWYWYLCGGATSGELYDSTTKRFKIRPVVYETTFGPGGNNPSVPDGHSLSSTNTGDDMPGVAKECLSFTEEARPEAPFRTDGSLQTSGVLRMQIHPANKSHGIIALGNTSSDTAGMGYGEQSLGFRFKIDPSGARVGPMIDPSDQLQPLNHYDVFVRADRVVVFVNGRQGFCVDLSDIPLTMKSAIIGYGDLIYHSALEWQELSDGAVNQNAQLYNQQLNEPIANTRVWDVVAHSDLIDVPAQFATFDPTLCRKPSNQAVQ